MLLAAAGPSSTTSIPTWLAVLAPVLAALVSGAAGTVGALLGSRTSARTAERIAERTAALNERLEGRRWADEMWRWNHERRERAYTALLAARDRLIEPEPAGTEYSEARAQVELFGSKAARDVASGWAQAIYGVMNCRRTEAEGVEGFHRRFHDLTEEDEWRASFIALIRQELRIDDR